MNDVVKTYWALANDPTDSSRGMRVTVVAPNIEAAKRILIEKYGVGNFIDLHGEEEASKVR